MSRAWIDDRVYIKYKYVDTDLLEKYYETTIKNYDQTETLLKLWTTVKYQSKKYIALPSGDIDKIKRIFKLKDSQIDDRREEHKMRHRLKWTGTLYDGTEVVGGTSTVNQQKLVEDWLKTKNGMIVARARAGKSYIGTNITCRLKLRTLIVVNQIELGKEFMKAFLSSTNLRVLRKRTGERIVGIVKNLSEIEDLDVAIITYQKFIREDGPEKIKKYLSGFSVLINDESHRVPALSYAKVINKISAKHKLGLTASPGRKDNKFHMILDIIGPIVAEAQDSALIPLIEIFETNIKPKYEYKNWTNGLKWLGANEERNKLIVANTFKALRAGHTAVMIPVDHIAHMQVLVKMLNKQAEYNEKNKKEKWTKEGYTFAVAFHGKSNRKVVKHDIDNGNHKVLVAIRSLVREGITLPPISHIESVIPISAGDTITVGSPAAYQLFYRACTPVIGKKPSIRIYLDRMGASCGTFRKLMRCECLPRLKGENPRYKMSLETKKRAEQIVNQPMKAYLTIPKSTGGKF